MTTRRTAHASSAAVEFDPLEALLGYHLRRAQMAVFQHFTRSIGALDITPGQFGVLALIDANPGLSQSRLGAALGIDRSSVVAVIDRLEGRGLVVRAAAPTDRRSHALHLSTRGTATLRRLKELVEAHERDIARDLSPGERAQLIALLRRVAR